MRRVPKTLERRALLFVIDRMLFLVWWWMNSKIAFKFLQLSSWQLFKSWSDVWIFNWANWWIEGCIFHGYWRLPRLSDRILKREWSWGSGCLLKKNVLLLFHCWNSSFCWFAQVTVKSSNNYEIKEDLRIVSFIHPYSEGGNYLDLYLSYILTHCSQWEADIITKWKGNLISKSLFWAPLAFDSFQGLDPHNFHRQR